MNGRSVPACQHATIPTGQHAAITPTCLVRMKGVEVCAANLLKKKTNQKIKNKNQNSEVTNAIKVIEVTLGVGQLNSSLAVNNFSVRNPPENSPNSQ